MSEAPLHMFVHLPKTAGQAVRTHLRKNLRDSQSMASLNAREEDRRSDILAELKARGPRLRLVVGHRVDRNAALEFSPRPLRLAIMLRDPASYVTSRFNWNVKQRELVPHSPETVDIFCRWLRRKTNPQARWLLTAYAGQDTEVVDALDDAALQAQALDVLDGFWCVGRTSDIAGTMAPFFASLGITEPFETRRNVAGEDYPRSIAVGDDPAIPGIIEEATRVDAAIYARYASVPAGVS